MSITRRVAVFLVSLWLVQAVPTPVSGQGPLQGAVTALRSGRYEAAVEEFSRLLRRDPSSVEAARGAVAALMETGRYADAEEVARRFKRDNRDSRELDNLLGRVLYETGRLDEAEAAFTAALGASDSLVARLNRAIVWHDRGEVDRAMREFDGFIDVYNGAASLSSAELTAVASAVRYLGDRDPVLFRDALRAYDEAIDADPGNLEPRLQLGEMFLQKYNGTDASATFEEVLALNPGSARGLLGMSRTRRFNGEQDSTGLLRRAIEVHPSLVAARVFKAVLDLEAEDYEQADAEIDRALEVNPASLEALAVRAATRFLQGDERAYQETVDRALALNPVYADLYTTLAEVSARNRLYRQAAAFARRATELNERSWRGFAVLGINQLRNGDISAGRQSLERAFQGDPYDVWTKNTLDLLDTLEQYTVSHSDRFDFVIDGKESELLSLYYEELAEEAYEKLARDYGHRPSTPIRVEVFPSHADFSVRTVGLVGLGALGVSFGPVVAMDSPSAREVGEFNWGVTLWHELAHTFHLGLSDHRVPRWFTEGLAVYEERRARDGWGNRLTPDFLMAYREGRLLPVSELNDGFMRPSYPGQVAHAYYQASLVCEFIEREHGYGALVAMLEGYAEGRSTADLVDAVLHTRLPDVDDAFDAFLDERFSDIEAVLPSGDPEDPRATYHSKEQVERRARTDANDFLAQLMMGRFLLEEGSAEEAIPYLERAKALIPEYAEGDSPYWYLAQIHRQRGDLRRAARELTTMTSLNDRHYAARLELAAIYRELGNSSAAARALEEVQFIYPFEGAVHAQLATLYAELSEWPAAIRERKAVLALDPVDRAESLYQLAQTYFDAGDRDLARRTVLRALEGAPNFEKAQGLLLLIHSPPDGRRP